MTNEREADLVAALESVTRRVHNLQHPAHRTFETCDMPACAEYKRLAKATVSQDAARATGER